MCDKQVQCAEFEAQCFRCNRLYAKVALRNGRCDMEGSFAPRRSDAYIVSMADSAHPGDMYDNSHLFADGEEDPDIEEECDSPAHQARRVRQAEKVREARDVSEDI